MTFSVAEARLRGAAVKLFMSKSTKLNDFKTLENVCQSTFLLMRRICSRENLSVFKTSFNDG